MKRILRLVGVLLLVAVLGVGLYIPPAVSASVLRTLTLHLDGYVTVDGEIYRPQSDIMISVYVSRWDYTLKQQVTDSHFAYTNSAGYYVTDIYPVPVDSDPARYTLIAVYAQSWPASAHPCSQYNIFTYWIVDSSVLGPPSMPLVVSRHLSGVLGNFSPAGWYLPDWSKEDLLIALAQDPVYSLYFDLDGNGTGGQLNDLKIMARWLGTNWWGEQRLIWDTYNGYQGFVPRGRLIRIFPAVKTTYTPSYHVLRAWDCRYSRRYYLWGEAYYLSWGQYVGLKRATTYYLGANEAVSCTEVGILTHIKVMSADNFPSDYSLIPDVEMTWRLEAGDINNDGVVNTVDSDLLAVAYWSQPGNPNWNCRADFNGDWVINAVDASILASNMWKTHPIYDSSWN